jgi:tRNA threonylcarbamoyladenosine biosynthesis protein TsaB
MKRDSMFKLLNLQSILTENIKQMATILLIETATEVCSTAISRNGHIIAVKEIHEGFNHSEMLTVYIEELLDENGIYPQMPEAVCVSKGPGSYTGLRIGVSVAKGICYALDIPLIAISTLDAMAYYVAQNPLKYSIVVSADMLLCPMLDARRMEVYYAMYDQNGKQITDISARIIDENSFAEELKNNTIFFFGNGALKCKPALSHPNAQFIEEVNASARFMPTLAENYFIQKKFENVAYFEPFYLKDFVATIPKNKVF